MTNQTGGRVKQLEKRIGNLEFISENYNVFNLTTNPLVQLLVDNEGNKIFKKVGNMCKFKHNKIIIGKSLYSL